MNRRIIGIDLAVTAQHQAAILDPATNQFLVKRMAFTALPADLDRLLERARVGAGAHPELLVVLEATGMAWYPVSLYLEHHGAKVFRVHGRMTKEMRRIRTPHARSDRIDCQTLATLYDACSDRLDRLYIPTGAAMTLQRACREYARWRELATAIDNRLTAYDNWVWQGLSKLVPTAALTWVRSEWYNPWEVAAAGTEALGIAWRRTPGGTLDDAAWISPWVERAIALTHLYHQPDTIDFPALTASIRRELHRRTQALQTQQELYEKTMLPLYRRLYPACPLTSIYGIGEASAATYMAFIHTIERFPNVDSFRQWTGMVPTSDQSGSTQTKGLHLTQAGPNLIKATLFLDANVARQWDPQLAHVYYTQMVHYGKHHTQAVCACASHLANRIYAVLKENRPYELRDLSGRPIQACQARRLIQEQLKVPEAVRSRTRRRSQRPNPSAPAA